MIFKYFGILLLVTLCAAHNGRRGGYGKSSGCQRSQSYGRSSKGHQYHQKEYQHYQKEYHNDYPKRDVLSFVEDIVHTIVKPLREQPKKYEERKREKKKQYIDYYSEEDYDDLRQRRQRQRPRNNEMRRSFIDYEYSDEYDDVQQQPPRTNRNRINDNRKRTQENPKIDTYKQRRNEEPTKKEKYTEKVETYKQRKWEEKPNTPNSRQPSTQRKNAKNMENPRKKQPNFFDDDDDFPDDDFPEERPAQPQNNIRQPIQRPTPVYDQYEYTYYEDYTGFAP